MKNRKDNLATLTIWSRNVTTFKREPTTRAWISANIWRQDGAIVLKIVKLSHIIGARGSQDLWSPSPIMAPGSKVFPTLILAAAISGEVIQFAHGCAHLCPQSSFDTSHLWNTSFISFKTRNTLASIQTNQAGWLFIAHGFLQGFCKGVWLAVSIMRLLRSIKAGLHKNWSETWSNLKRELLGLKWFGNTIRQLRQFPFNFPQFN